MKQYYLLGFFLPAILNVGCGRPTPEPISEATAQPIYRSASSSEGVNSLVTSPTGKLIAFARLTGEVVVYDTALERESVFTTKPFSARSPSFSRDDHLLAVVCDREKQVLVWDLRSQQLVNAALLGDFPFTIQFEAYPLALCFSRTENCLFIAAGSEVKCWDVKKNMWRPFVVKCEVASRTVVCSPVDHIVAVSMQDKVGHHNAAEKGYAEIACWDDRTGVKLGSFHERTSQPLSMAFSPDGKLMAIRTDDAILLSTEKLSLTGQKLVHSQIMVAFAFSPDSKAIFAIDSRGNCIKWEIDTERKTACGSLGMATRTGSFSFDCEYVVTGHSPGPNFALWKRESLFGK